MLLANRIQAAITQLQQGRPIVLVDDRDRENEADLVYAGGQVTADDITFMLQHTCGIICVAMDEASCERLQLPPMVTHNKSHQTTPFAVSFEAAHGISTGVSSLDRAHSIRTVAQPNATPLDIVRPGHLFPLCANPQGVFGRRGHTEGSVDLMRVAQLPPVAAICELMHTDGTMMRGAAVSEFAQEHALMVLSVEELYQYRLQTEDWLVLTASTVLPTEHGEFEIKVFKSKIDQTEHVALCSSKQSQQPLVRVHSCCLTGDVFQSLRCDCGRQLELAMAHIAREGGALIYCDQEGRGIGLTNKIKAYALQEQGRDTVEANHQLGFKADERDYTMAAKILQYLNWDSIKLLTNNIDKMAQLQSLDIKVTERVALEVGSNKHNEFYLQTKKDKLGHLLQLKDVETV